jgi:hypothetical protein
MGIQPLNFGQPQDVGRLPLESAARVMNNTAGFEEMIH